MKIAQISPLIESVPPRLYGGTERVVAYLTDELVRQGHDVTLFASGDSQTSASLLPGCRQALRLDPNVREHIPNHLMMMEQVKRLAPGFDVLHFHTDLVHFPVFSGTGNPTLTTLHGRQDRSSWRASTQVFLICRWSRSPMRSADQSPTRTLPAPFSMAFPPISFHPP